MSEWQPIETAPKDGTRILLGGRWLPFDINPGGGWFAGVFSWTTISGNPDADDYFWLGDGPSDASHYNVDFTHWHPLPPPPKDSK